MGRARAAAVGGVVAAVWLVAVEVDARADAEAAARCVTASELGQTERNKKRLLSATDAFVRCSAAECPAIVRRACTEWLAEVEEVVPSLVIAVTQQSEDGRTADALDAEVKPTARS